MYPPVNIRWTWKIQKHFAEPWNPQAIRRELVGDGIALEEAQPTTDVSTNWGVLPHLVVVYNCYICL